MSCSECDEAASGAEGGESTEAWCAGHIFGAADDDDVSAASFVNIGLAFKFAPVMGITIAVGEDEASMTGDGAWAQPDIYACELTAVRGAVSEKMSGFWGAKSDGVRGLNRARRHFVFEGAAISRCTVDSRGNIDADDRA